MSWNSAKKLTPVSAVVPFARPSIIQHKPDWKRLVFIDFETYYDQNYTLSKLSTSEYVRDPRFKAQMMGIKIGRGKTQIVPPAKIKYVLMSIDWSTHTICAHNMLFDGFILSHHYGIVPSFYYDTLAMARGLHSNDIGAGLDEVSQYYGGSGKLEGLEATKGVLDWDKSLFAATSTYCANDVDEMVRVFEAMLLSMPSDEMYLIDLTCRMFCAPVLQVDIPRVEKELARELDRREVLMYAAVNPADWENSKLLVGKDKLLTGKDRDLMLIRKVIGSNEKFAALLRAEHVEPPMKISPKWMKMSREEREASTIAGTEDDDKYVYAFSKDDEKFLALPYLCDAWGYDRNNVKQVEEMVAKQERLQALIDVRIAVKSTTNITRAQRFLTAGANGMPLPVGYAYYAAHTGRFGGTNKMNMQNLERIQRDKAGEYVPGKGELRLSIIAPKGHVVSVVDSGQIECRVNGWLWKQDDLIAAFRAADRGIGRDAYCNFGDTIYGRTITKADKTERFVSKVAVLGLGYQMGPPKFQITLAKGALGGPPIHFTLDECKAIVNAYRLKHFKIVAGWKTCDRIIEDMAAGREGSYGPLNWEANTIWLPNGMRLKYPDLRKATGEKGWDEWTYQSGNMRKKIYSGLLCLGAKTQVLTDNGWKPIVEVTLSDKLWDSANWVSHSGLVYQGTKETISFGGVDMTPEHEVLVNNHWFAAKETTHYEATSSFKRHHRGPDRNAESDLPNRQRWSQDLMDSTVPMRGHPSDLSLGIHEGQHEELRMLDSSIYIRGEDNTRNVETPRLRSMEGHARPMQSTEPSGLGALRWAGNHCLSAMEQLRDLLDGYADWLLAGVGIRPTKQLAGLQPRELSLGDGQGQLPKHKGTSFNRNADWPDTFMACCRAQWDKEHDATVSQARRMASSQNVRQAECNQQDVFDLVDAGPLRRFTVRGDDGMPFIVHNCENIVQALARIIVCWQMLQASKKYRVVLTTHDEFACVVKAAQAATCFKNMTKWMTTAPEWCADLPLASEGGFDVRYSK